MNPGLLRIALLLGLATFSPARAAEKAAIRVVGCDEKVPSRKRGIGTNGLKPADFRALAPGVSWYYNWHYEPGKGEPRGSASPLEFLPMVWGDNPESLAGLARYLDAGHKPRQVLAINEPNLKGQATLTPERSAALFRKVKAIADRRGLSVVGPQMAIGTPPNESVSAYDPLDRKEVTYTFMVPFLKAFFSFMGRDSVRAIAIHPYDRFEALRALTELSHREFQRPIWVTEFNGSHTTPDLASARLFLIRSTDYLERSPDVEGYAWFMDRLKGSPNVSLLADEPGKLTPLGETYVAMPVHDADLYYKIPGRLQAEKYARVDRMEPWPTNDRDGFLHLAAEAPDAWADYNVQVMEAGAYTLRFRVTGKPGAIDVVKDGKAIAILKTSPAAPDQWANAEATIRLDAGPQTLRIRARAAGQGINWVEFARK